MSDSLLFAVRVSLMDILDEVMQYLADDDSFAAIEYLNRQGDALAVARAYANVVNHLYWKAKHLPYVIAMARAGIQYDLSAALAEPDPRLAGELRSMAKKMARDLASFTWPGWAEEDVLLDPSDLAAGRDAARACLRLAHELNEGALALARAYWMMGAHLWAAGDWDEAQRNFNESVKHAEGASCATEALLAKAYAAAVATLHSSEHALAVDQLKRIKLQLSHMEAGEFMVSQIDTAMRVFSAQGRS
jgi:hypothetical protein